MASRDAVREAHIRLIGDKRPMSSIGIAYDVLRASAGVSAAQPMSVLEAVALLRAMGGAGSADSADSAPAAQLLSRAGEDQVNA
jgi:hypothetical protein